MIKFRRKLFMEQNMFCFSVNKLPDVPAVQVPKESVEKPLIQPDFRMNLPELSSDSPMQQMKIHHLQKPHGN